MMNTKNIFELAAGVLSGQSLNEAKFHTNSDHLTAKGKMKEMVDAQIVGKPLLNKDGSEVSNTIYLGSGSYLAKEGALYLVCSFGNARVGADDSMPWEKYISFDNKVTLNAEAVKNVGKFITKL